jgi:RNA recognition motif-containing protein
MIQYIAIAVVVIVLLVVIILAAKRRCATGKKAPAKQPKSRVSSEHSGPANTQLYIGNIPYRSNDQDLHDFFSRYGDIDTVRVIKDRRTGRSKGFAFVTYVDLDDAAAALDAHEQEFEGRALIVRYAKPSGR